MRQTTVLIVENQIIEAADIQKTLIQSGYGVIGVALTFQEAITSIETTRPDVVLMDIHLGEQIDGVQAAEEIRCRFDIPVVYVTGLADEQTLQRAKISEAFGYILKPFSERELHTIIEIALYKHQTEQELRLYRDHLEEQVKARTSELVRVNTQLQAANQAKSEFLSTMSHELRTPLNIILGYAQQLSHDQSLPQTHLKAVNSIQRSGEHLLVMINEVLDLNKIERNTLELEPEFFHLPEFLSNLRDMFTIRASRKGITFRTEFAPGFPQKIYADEKRLRQILMNLLSNAIKFTTNGHVQLRLTNSHTHTFRFEVSDTGPGIAPEELENIFQPFHQTGDVRARSEGIGLGLPISQKLVRVMGGELSVQSVPGQGSTFWFDLELPVSKETADLPEQDTSPPSSCQEAFTPPPQKDLHLLYKLSKIGDVMGLRRQIREIQLRDPRFAVFTERIGQFAEDLELHNLRRYLEHYLQDEEDTDS